MNLTDRKTTEQGVEDLRTSIDCTLDLELYTSNPYIKTEPSSLIVLSI